MKRHMIDFVVKLDAVDTQDAIRDLCADFVYPQLRARLEEIGFYEIHLKVDICTSSVIVAAKKEANSSLELFCVLMFTRKTEQGAEIEFTGQYLEKTEAQG